MIEKGLKGLKILGSAESISVFRLPRKKAVVKVPGIALKKLGDFFGRAIFRKSEWISPGHVESDS